MNKIEILKSLLEAKGSYDFSIEYPAGSNYIKGLAEALKHFGFRVFDDPQLEGSDTDGIIATTQANAPAVKKLIGKYKKDLDNEEVDSLDAADEFEKGLDALKDTVSLSQDWKHLDWKDDAKTLKKVFGLTLTRGETDNLVLSK